MSCMGVLGYPISAIAGLDQRGNQYASFLNDPVGAALAALPWRDGQDTGGWPWDLQSTIPNVEDNELFYPVLYVWRREVANSGRRGQVPGRERMRERDHPPQDRPDRLGHGGGGGRGAGSRPVRRVSDVDELLPADQGRPDATSSWHARAGRRWIPTSSRASTEWVAAKSFGKFTEAQDMWIFSWAGAGGYGDPVERDPARCSRTCARGG